MCGGKAEEFASGTTECYGYAWQTAGIRCIDELKRKCDMDISICLDTFSYPEIDRKLWPFLEKMWNELPRE